MSMVKTATRSGDSVDLEPIDRLEDKIKRLVSLVDGMRSEQARAAEEHQRLSREIDSLRARLASSETGNAELSAMRDERDVIRTRVSEMLEQLEALNL
jgi:regulator of replication initiation timing